MLAFQSVNCRATPKRRGAANHRLTSAPLALTLCVLTLVGATGGALAQLSDDDRRCLDAVYNSSRKVAQQEFRGNWRDCIRNKTGNQDACIDADRPKSTDKAGQLASKYNQKCATLPAFGVIISVANVIDAAQDAPDAVIRNKWGSPVDPDGGSCHSKIAKGVGNLGTEQWKKFRRCVKDLETVGSIADIEACIAEGIAAGTADEGPDIISDVMGGSCAGPIPHFDDGDCDSLPLAAAAQCIIDNVECEVCNALNGITGANAYCATISGIPCHTPVHKCTFDESTDNSNLGIFLGGNTDLSALFGDIAGAIDITCDPETEDANGKRACTCELQTWTPSEVTGLGFICVTPLAGCPVGEMDCDGGNSLGIDAADDSQIGTCASHADCASQCDTYCAGLSKVQWRSGCESLCQAGSRDGQTCICDKAGTGGCTGGIAGTNDCPGGSCVGKNNELDQDCQCQCIDYATGGPSAAGDIRCNLGMGFRIVPSLPCPNPDVSIYINQPPVCIPLTSQVATGETIIANENQSPGIGPHTLFGAAETCSNFDTSITTGLQLVANIGSFDNTLGDVRAHLTLDCQ